MMPTIHPTAIVHPSARIADSVRIGPYCVIEAKVTIGRGTVLHNHVIIQSLTTLGEDNQIYPFAVLGADPQDRKFRASRSTVSLATATLSASMSPSTEAPATETV